MFYRLSSPTALKWMEAKIQEMMWGKCFFCLHRRKLHFSEWPLVNVSVSVLSKTARKTLLLFFIILKIRSGLFSLLYADKKIHIYLSFYWILFTGFSKQLLCNESLCVFWLNLHILTFLFHLCFFTFGPTELSLHFCCCILCQSIFLTCFQLGFVKGPIFCEIHFSNVLYQ